MALIDNPKLNEILAFIHQHEQDDPAQLVLKYSGETDLPYQAIAQQIAARQKAKKKLSTLYKEKELIFPPPLSMEQCSSEATALYKASIVKGGSIADLTGGFGIDSYFLSQSFEKSIYIEQSEELCKIASYNFQKLKADIKVVNQTAEAFLKSNDQYFDCIFLDPARRDENKRKVYQWADCQPNLNSILPKLLSQSEQVLVKAAPILDITKAIHDLDKHVKEVHIVEWEKEVKELLFILDKDQYDNSLIKVVQLDHDGGTLNSFEGSRQAEEEKEASIALPDKYLYEPSPAMMKSGLFNSFSSKYQLSKLHPNTQLYTSDQPIKSFPGNKYQIETVTSPQKKAFKKAFKVSKANLKTRNFPIKVEELKKKLGIKDGGNTYIFATTLADNSKSLLICKKVEDQ